ncbi:MAG TPA: ribonuclease III [Acidimicrobiia bacterium]|nr:ribonuclease III [Acidimicrobiia bacterium]
MDDPLDRLEAALGHSFADRSLLIVALTHPSYGVEQERPAESYGRLEFLGDAVLDLVVTTELYTRWNMSEGEMTKTRAAVVSERPLAVLGTELGLPEAMFLGKGEEVSGGRHKEAIISDVMESVLAAVYLDAGFDAVSAVILNLWRPLIKQGAVTPGEADHKSVLQEALAIRGQVPIYRTEGSGPDHERVFDAEVLVDGVVVGRGTGTSKKRAEAVAASHALIALGLDAG